MRSKATSCAFCLYLALLGISSVFGFHVHHSEHEGETVTHFETSKNHKEHLKDDLHCEQHCRLETLLEHAFDGSAIIQVVNTELNNNTSQSEFAFNIDADFVTIKPVLGRFICYDSRLRFFIQPQAPPVA